MNLRPAYEAIVLEHGSDAVTLRPSLRAASSLERSHDGFAKLFQRIAEFDTGTVREIIITAATDRKDAAAFLAAMSRLPLSRFIEIAQASLAQLCMGFIPASQENARPAPNAKLTPWREAYRDLYGYATGWLLWTPDCAWKATPTEITDALSGHFDMLKAIHGAANDDKPAAQHDQNIKLDRVGLNKLRGKGGLR